MDEYETLCTEKTRESVRDPHYDISLDADATPLRLHTHI